jgi:glutamine amidotransferase
MNQNKIAIIDYGMGNLRSVANAFYSIKCQAFVTNKPEELCEASHIVLPGVGAFRDGIKNLQSAGWIKFLETEVIEKKKPFLGICLGMQLLATFGTEHGYHKGLNWIPGTVNRLEINEDSIRVPHIGWNDVDFVKQNGLYRGLGNSQVFYFVHSYVLQPEDKAICSALTSHGSEFISSIEMGNIYATQFHPEKSQKAGLEVLNNFVKGNFINNA